MAPIPDDRNDLWGSQQINPFGGLSTEAAENKHDSVVEQIGSSTSSRVRSKNKIAVSMGTRPESISKSGQKDNRVRNFSLPQSRLHLQKDSSPASPKRTTDVGLHTRGTLQGSSEDAFTEEKLSGLLTPPISGGETPNSASTSILDFQALADPADPPSVFSEKPIEPVKELSRLLRQEQSSETLKNSLAKRASNDLSVFRSSGPVPSNPPPALSDDITSSTPASPSFSTRGSRVIVRAVDNDITPKNKGKAPVAKYQPIIIGSPIRDRFSLDDIGRTSVPTSPTADVTGFKSPKERHLELVAPWMSQEYGEGKPPIPKGQRSPRDKNVELIAPWLSQEYQTPEDKDRELILPAPSSPTSPSKRPRSSRKPSSIAIPLTAVPESATAAFLHSPKGSNAPMSSTHSIRSTGNSSDRSKGHASAGKQRTVNSKPNHQSGSSNRQRRPSVSSSRSSGSVGSSRAQTSSAVIKHQQRMKNDTTMLRAPSYTPGKPTKSSSPLPTSYGAAGESRTGPSGQGNSQDDKGMPKKGSSKIRKGISSMLLVKEPTMVALENERKLHQATRADSRKREEGNSGDARGSGLFRMFSTSKKNGSTIKSPGLATDERS